MFRNTLRKYSYCMLYGDLPSLAEFDLKLPLLGGVTQSATLKNGGTGFYGKARSIAES